LGGLSLTALMLWADRRPQSATPSPSSPSRNATQTVAQKKGRFPPAVSTILEQETSAYHARLFADEEGVVLVTQTGFTLLRSGEAAEEHTIPLGPVAVRQGSSIVFWHAGWLRQIPISGESGRRLAALTRAPQYVLASEHHLAWIDFERDTGSSLHTIAEGAARVVYESRERVCASVLRGQVVYWILQSRDASWKIGSIGLDGQHRKMTAAHRGRPPAMLALGPDGVYFYDGPERGLRRLTFELDREDAVATHVICSPLVVTNRAICAQVGGLFDVPLWSTAPRFLASEREGPITALAATEERLFWVAESGTDQLVVRTTPLPAL
jgi:hypothetical protein